MTRDSIPQQDDCEVHTSAHTPTSDIESEPSNSSDHKAISIVIPTDTPKAPSLGKTMEDKASNHASSEGFILSDNMKRNGRMGILILCVAFMIVGRYSVPDNEVKCVQDKIIEALQFANSFINTPGNEGFRDFFQGLCSLMVDAVFILTFGYWVLKGTNGRLPVTLALFYITRALVQKVWYSPFPEGFYWESPGVPSLVVPYGRGSDFFFSGHSGFLVICASEWHRLKFPRMRNFTILAGLYTILILLTYRIHYTIDVFTGVFFAEWCFGKVDTHKDLIDGYWVAGITKLRNLLMIKPGQMLFMDTNMSSLNHLEEKHTA